jgi:hypothetical protein
MTPDTIVVPIDESTPTAQVLPVLAGIAERTRAKVRLLAIAHDDGEQAWAYEAVHAAADQLSVGGAAADVVIDSDPAGVLLVIAAESGTVLCLSARDRPWEGGSILGRIGARVTERATQPFLLVAESGAPPVAEGDVVVALDGGSDPAPTLTIALEWANRLGAPLRLVTVYEPVPAVVRRPDHYSRRHGPLGDADAYLDGVRHSVGEEAAAGCTSVAIADPVSVASGLSQHLAAHPAFLVVVGSHEPHHWLTTEARALLQTSAPPMLVAPHPHPQ